MIILDKVQLKKIGELVFSYSGILFDRIATRQIEKKIEEQIKKLGIGRVKDYIQALEGCLNSSVKTEMEELISELTVSESFFFRNPDQFNYLLNQYFPEKIKQFHGRVLPIKIWSAGCARGEEPYSIAALVKHFMQENPEQIFHIYAGDINTKNLAYAREAFYKKRAHQNKIENFQARLQVKIGEIGKNDSLTVFEDIKSLVSFCKLNLKEIKSLNVLSGSNVIFCRNVLIYFEEELRRKLLKEFFNLLAPGGILFLGESECLPRDFNYFEVIQCGKAYIYKKPIIGK